MTILLDIKPLELINRGSPVMVPVFSAHSATFKKQRSDDGGNGMAMMVNTLGYTRWGSKQWIKAPHQP